MLLLADRYLSAWHGSDDSDEAADGDTDYDRACAINDYAGSIAVADSQAIVLGDASMHAVWWPLATDRGVVARVEFTESDEHLRKLLRETDYEALKGGDLELVLPPGGLWLFEAAYGGDELTSNSLRIDLPAGRYRVRTHALQTKSV